MFSKKDIVIVCRYHYIMQNEIFLPKKGSYSFVSSLCSAFGSAAAAFSPTEYNSYGGTPSTVATGNEWLTPCVN